MNADKTASSRFPVLHTARLDLVEISEHHVEDLYHLFSNKNVTRFYNLLPFCDKQEAVKLLQYFRSRYEQMSAIRWGICLREEGRLIGTAGFNNYTRMHRASIGYDLHPEYWNRGLSTEALKCIIRFGFSELGVNRIEAEVMQGNLASERVLYKLGFHNEGILREWLYWNNTYHDMTMFSLLKSEFLPGETED